MAFGRTGTALFDADAADGPTAFAGAHDEFVAAIRNGAPVSVDVARGLEIQRLLDAVSRAISELGTVDVER